MYIIFILHNLIESAKIDDNYNHHFEEFTNSTVKNES